jgi:hypothetical protein
METESEPDDQRPLPGASCLRRCVDLAGLSIPDWCEVHGLDRFAIQKLLNGRLQRVSVELAFDIEEATEGVVEAKLWIPEEEMREAQRLKRREAAQERARAVRERRLEKDNATR